MLPSEVLMFAQDPTRPVNPPEGPPTAPPEAPPVEPSVAPPDQPNELPSGNPPEAPQPGFLTAELHVVRCRAGW